MTKKLVSEKEPNMKKLIQINTVCNASTGKIMLDIQKRAEEDGYETLSLVGRGKLYQKMRCEKYGDFFSFWIHVGINTLFDRQGYGSYFTTKKLVKRLKEEKPDIIHLHNLHGYYLYLPELFHYLSNEYEGKIFWTFHDCWPITGHCAYFTMANCDKWKEECSNCPSKRQYPISLGLDASYKNYCEKKKMFTQLRNLKIIVPSEWMKSIVKQSFMKDCSIEVINNGIDLEKFRYLPNKEVMQKYKISCEKKILLGVAKVWDKRKGLEDFLELSHRLSEDYQIILVGLSKCQIINLPSSIIGIPKMDSIADLVAIYSQSYIFINPSREESFSLVTVEAMACGTPVIALDTSAVKELICNENGIVLRRITCDDYLWAIEEIKNKNLTREKIRKTVEKYSCEIMLNKVMKLYKNG